MQFFEVAFKCESCEHSTEILFEKNVDISEIQELCSCYNCNSKMYINVGDFGFRTDWPNADYFPWQAQIIKVKSEFIFCDNCVNKKSSDLGYEHLAAICPLCLKETMNVTSINFTQKDDLSRLLKKLSDNG
jgi:hypothetical protein